ncbi:MAG: phosphate/phosphite/phosphonate ABC transporter substrate-binding protein [Bdellovibrionia bacterium]
MKASKFVLMLTAVLLFTACTKQNAELGSADNPVKFFFVPSVDSKRLLEQAKIVEAYLIANTPYKYEVKVPSSYVAVVEAFGTKRADVASLNTFGYIMANEKYQTEARLIVIRNGLDTYQAQILARADSDIKKLDDLNGKKFAFVDPASTSGYLLPAKLFADKNIKPKETIFANKHDNVIMMIQQKQVDAGATFYSPPEKGEIQDARRLVKTQIPDVEKKIKIIELTEAIPNDPIVFRKDMPEEMKTKIVAALQAFIKTDEGKKAFYESYSVTDFKTATDANYDTVRDMLKKLGKTAGSLMKN